MTHYKFLTGLLLSTSLFLSACNLTVAQTGATTGSTTETTPVSSAESVPDEASVRYVLEQSANAMLKVQSYDYVSTNVSKFGNSEVTSTTKATIFPIKGDGWNETTQNGAVNTTYLKANTMYMIDPRTQSWVFVDMAKSTGFTQIRVNPKVNEYMTMTKTNSGYLIKSTHPLSALEFYMLSGIEGKEMQNLADMVDQGIALDTVVEIELDEAYRYKQVIYDQVTTTGGVSTQSYFKYEYSKYDIADPIVLPADILKNAVKLDTGSAGSTKPVSVPDPTLPEGTTSSGASTLPQTMPAETTSPVGSPSTRSTPATSIETTTPTSTETTTSTTSTKSTKPTEPTAPNVSTTP